jgi:hypothetical protein
VSTTYYALRHPIARVRGCSDAAGLRFDAVDRSGVVVATFRPGALHLLADRNEQVAHRSGLTISVSATGTDETQAISEYGDLVTLGELRREMAP